MEQNQTSTKQVIMDAEVLDMLIGEQDYSERLRKYSFKLQVMKVSEGYYVTNKSDETIVIIVEGPIDIVKNRDVLFLTSDNKILFKLPASESCVLNHNEFMLLSCQPEISFVYSNGKINTLYKEDELEDMDMDMYTLFSKLEFQYTSEPDTDNDDDDDLFADLLSGLEEDEPDDGPVQITYQEISDREYIYSDEDEEYLTDKEFEELEAELEAEEAEKEFNITIGGYALQSGSREFGKQCIKEVVREALDTKDWGDIVLHTMNKYSEHLHVTNLFTYKNGNYVIEAYKIKNISNETVYIVGGDVGLQHLTYKMLRPASSGYEFKLHANNECLLTPDEFIWLCVQPEIAFKFSNGAFKDKLGSFNIYELAYQIIKDKFKFLPNN